MELNFDHITGAQWKTFESLTAAYFEEIRRDKNALNQIKSVVVKKSGTGADMGKDIVVTFKMNDSISDFENKWVIQCKCYTNDDVAPKHISTVNIPTLIHKYRAVGYLLVCRGGYTNQIREMFEDLSKECKMKYKYEVWDGDDFINRILNLGCDNKFIEQYFNGYFNFVKKQQTKVDKLKKIK